MYKNFVGGRKSRAGSRQLRRGLEMFNLSAGDIHETRSIRADIQSRNLADDFAPFMLDREAVAQHRDFCGETGKRSRGERHQDGKTQPK